MLPSAAAPKGSRGRQAGGGGRRSPPCDEALERDRQELHDDCAVPDAAYAVVGRQVHKLYNGRAGQAPAELNLCRQDGHLVAARTPREELHCEILP